VIGRHLKEAGAETPLHFTRYYPAYKLHNPPANVETLERAYEVARKAGILHPHLGNVPGHTYENTYCPNCKARLIQRLGYTILKYEVLANGKCPKCGETIHIAANTSKNELAPSLARAI
jgi:pyruvate formate lyase activating enzyme